jgi:sigma-B regulation protein RsbU (phosphoserine phosphatase)
VRIEAGQRVLTLEQSLKHKNQQLRESKEALEASQQRINNDLQAAAAIQRELLPRSKIDSLPLELAWDFMPADELAGDIFNFFALDDEHLGFYLADVCGHGVPAAMLSVHVARLLSAEPRPDSIVHLPASDSRPAARFSLARLFGQKPVGSSGFRQPREVAARLNTQFEAEPESMQYFSMVYGVLNTRSGRGSLCQAGHPYPLICRSNGHIERIGTGGLPIGLMPDAEYQQHEFELQAGDRLLVYSDGITECQSADGEQFAEKRLAETLLHTRAQSLEEMIAEVNTALAHWRGTQHGHVQLQDDASMLAIALSAPITQTEPQGYD